MNENEKQKLAEETAEKIMKKEPPKTEQVLQLPVPVVDYIRKDDYVMLYWLSGGGNFAWLVERGHQLFFFTVLGMRHLFIRHWKHNENESQVDIVRNVVACMGFQEHPVYAPVRNADKVLVPLLNDIKLFEEKVKQNPEIVPPLHKTNDNKPDSSGPDKDPKDNVRPIRDEAIDDNEEEDDE